MGLMDQAKGLAGKVAAEHVDDAVDAAADKVQDATGHRFDGAVDQGAEAVKDEAHRRLDQ